MPNFPSWDAFKEQHGPSYAAPSEDSSNYLYDSYKGSQSGGNEPQTSSEEDEEKNKNNPENTQEKREYSVQETAQQANNGQSFSETALADVTGQQPTAQQQQPEKKPGLLDKPEIKTTPERDALLEEYKRIQNSNAMPAVKRREEIQAELDRMDEELGNGKMDHTFSDRVASTISGAGKQIGSNITNAAGTIVRGMGESSASANPALLKAQGLSDDEIKAELEKASSQNKGQRMTDVGTAIQGMSDEMAASAQQDLERAKANLSRVGAAGVDIATNVIQMGFDAAVGALTGGGSLASMFVRSAGGAMQKARNEGATTNQQLLYGGVTGGIEALTEKLADGVAHIYGAGAADEFTERLIRRLSDSEFGQTVLRGLIGMASEGTEEVISDLLAPYAETIYNNKGIGEVLQGTFTGTYDPSEMLYDYIIGAAIGMLGGGTSAISGQSAEANARIAQTNEIQNALMEKGMNEKDAFKASEYLAKAANGEQLTKRQQAFLDSLQEANGIEASAPDVSAQQAEAQTTPAPQQQQAPVTPTQQSTQTTAPQSSTIDERRAKAREDYINTFLEQFPGDRVGAESEADNILGNLQARIKEGSIAFGNSFTSGDQAFKDSIQKRKVAAVNDYLKTLGYQLDVDNVKVIEKGNPNNDIPGWIFNIVPYQETESSQNPVPQSAPKAAQNAPQGSTPSQNTGTPPTQESAPTGESQKLNSEPEETTEPQPEITPEPEIPSEESAPAGEETSEETTGETATEESPEGVPPMPPQEPTEQSTSSDYSELGEEYGTMEQGEKAERESNTPKRTAPGTKVSQAVRNVQEAKATPESRLPDVQSAIAEGQVSFVSISNAERATNAETKIKGKGWNSALKDWTAAVRSGQANADLVAEGAVLLNNAGNNPECSGAEYIDLMLDYVRLNRTMGQGLQAARILKTLSPEGRLYAFQKTVQNMNDAFKEKVTPKQQAKNEEKAKADNTKKAEKVNKAVKGAKEKAARTVFTFEYADEASQMIARAVEARAKPKTQRSKTMMEELVDTIKKFAVERVPTQSTNVRRMTATDLLAELSNNEEFAREAYELAQHQVRQDTIGTPSAAAASGFSDAGMDLNNSNIVKRAVAESAVSTNENRNTILNQSALGIGENEIANSIAQDLIDKTGASEDIANSIREASLDYVREVLGSETFENAEEADAAANGRIETLVKRAMNQIGEQFRNLALSDEYTRQAALQAVKDTLSEQYGVNGQSATRIAETIVGNFDARLNDAIREELQNRFGEKEAKEIIGKQMPDKLAEAINLGAFTSEYASQAIGEVFGVQGQYTIDPALVDEYRQQTTDEGRDEVLDRMQQAIADQIPSTLKDKFTAIRYLNMLGNLKTQVRNIAGNIGMGTVQKTKNTIRSVAETIASAATGGKYEKQYSAFYGRDLKRAARNDFKSNEAIQKEAMGERKYTSASAEYQNEIENKRNVWKFGDNKLTRALGIEGKQGPLGKVLSIYETATEKMMNDIGDKFFVAQNYTDALAGYLQAHKITADQWTTLVAEAESDPGSDAAETVDKARQFAVKQAQEATFRDTNAVSEFAQNFDKNWGKAKILTQGIMPFRKTPANVGVRMEEYSPLGFINTTVKAIQAAKGNGNVTGADVVDSLSKSLTGTGLAYLGFVLAAAGKARTKSDDDKQEAFDKLRGLQDYSITVNGTNYTLDWATPAAASIFMGVEAYNLFEDGDVTADEMMKIMGNLTSPMLEMSMLSGLNDALNNISNFNDDTDALPQFVLNSAWSYLTQGFTNTLLGQLEQANEEYRQTYYTDPDNPFIPTSVQRDFAKAGNKTPGVDYQAADYIDAWGRKQANFDNPLFRYAYALGSPAYVSGDKSTAVDNELQRLYDYGKDIDGFPSVLPKQTSRSTTVNGTRLSADEYEKYATTKGQESLRLVTELVNSSLYKNLDDEGKAEAISECYSYAKYLADDAISKSRKEENKNDTYENLITGVDKSGTQYDKTGLNPSNFVAYTTIKVSLDNAVKAGNYKAIDKIVSDYGKQNNNLKTVLNERNAVLRALGNWKNAGLNSQDYYTIQKELVKSQQKLNKSQKTGSAVELDALANSNLPESKKKQLVNSLPDYTSKTVKGVYNILSDYGFDSKTINKFWNDSQDWVYKDSGDAQSSQKAGTLQPLEAAYAIQQLPGLTPAQMSEIYNKLKAVAHNPYKINDWGNWTFTSEKNYLESGRSNQAFGGSTTTKKQDSKPPSFMDSKYMKGKK